MQFGCKTAISYLLPSSVKLQPSWAEWPSNHYIICTTNWNKSNELLLDQLESLNLILTLTKLITYRLQEYMKTTSNMKPTSNMKATSNMKITSNMKTTLNMKMTWNWKTTSMAVDREKQILRIMSKAKGHSFKSSIKQGSTRSRQAHSRLFDHIQQCRLFVFEKYWRQEDPPPDF